MCSSLLRCALLVVVTLSYWPIAASAKEMTCSHLLAKQMLFNSADISKDGTRLAIVYTAAESVSNIDVFDLASGQRTYTAIRSWIRAPGSLESVRWDNKPFSNLLLVSKSSFGIGGSISAINLDTQHVSLTYKCAKCTYFDVSLNQKMSVIQRTSQRKFVLEIKDRFPNGKTLALIRYPRMFVDEISLSPNGNRVAFAVDTSNIERKSFGAVQVAYDISSQRAYTLPGNFLRSTWFSNDEIFVPGQNNMAVYIQNILTGERRLFAEIQLDSHYDAITGVMADPQFRRLLVLAKGKTTANDLYVVDTQCGQR